jgi:hypothetical protein
MGKKSVKRTSVNRLNTEIFVSRSIEKHGNKYDYYLSEYVNQYSSIKIVCPIHGIFEQLAKSHMNGKGCSKCSGSLKSNNKDFIEKSNKIHDNKYDYSLVDYINNKTKIKIICPIHGIFEQRPDTHIKKQGCRECGILNRIKKQSNNNEIFIHKANKIHGNKYDYSLVDYETNKNKVTIKCLNHGIFKQRPNNHLNGDGCPYCSNSKGEMIIKKLLTESDIEFIEQHKFHNCRHKRLLKFDFYLLNHNICVEYDGKQHFEPYWYDSVKYNESVKRDMVKNEFCLKNKIPLIRIKYDNTIFLNNKIIPLKFKKNMDFKYLIDFVTTNLKQF